jgi:hypothetical protein
MQLQLEVGLDNGFVKLGIKLGVKLDDRLGVPVLDMLVDVECGVIVRDEENTSHVCPEPRQVTGPYWPKRIESAFSVPPEISAWLQEGEVRPAHSLQINLIGWKRRGLCSRVPHNGGIAIRRFAWNGDL